MATQADFDALKVAHDAALAELNKLRFKVFAQHEQAQQESEQTIANLRVALGEAVKVPLLQKHVSQLEGLVSRYEKRIAKLEAEPASDTERQPQSEFFTARLIDQGELPWVEIRALASTGLVYSCDTWATRRRSTNWGGWPCRLIASITT